MRAASSSCSRLASGLPQRNRMCRGTRRITKHRIVRALVWVTCPQHPLVSRLSLDTRSWRLRRPNPHSVVSITQIPLVAEVQLPHGSPSCARPNPLGEAVESRAQLGDPVGCVALPDRRDNALAQAFSPPPTDTGANNTPPCGDESTTYHTNRVNPTPTTAWVRSLSFGP